MCIYIPIQYTDYTTYMYQRRQQLIWPTIYNVIDYNYSSFYYIKPSPNLTSLSSYIVYPQTVIPRSG